MGFLVCGGACLNCTFGMVPGVLNVLPAAKVINNLPVANIMDNKPIVNITGFGMCKSLANPTVAAATAAALGTLTPMPCVPVIPSPWAPGVPTVMVGGKPAVNNSCKCNCVYGGVISISNAGQTTIQV